MRVYIESLLPSNLDTHTLNKQESTTTSYYTVFSEEGIYKVTDGSVFKLIVSNDEVYQIKHGKHNMTLDLSLIEEEISFRLPLNHKAEFTIEIVYNVPKSNLRLCVLKDDKAMTTDCYFEFSDYNDWEQTDLEGFFEFVSTIN